MRLGVYTVLFSDWSKEDNSSTFYCEKGVLHLYAHLDYSLIIDYDHEKAEYQKTGKNLPTSNRLNQGSLMMQSAKASSMILNRPFQALKVVKP